MSDTHECPSVEQLKLLADGRLSDPPASEFEVHLLECESCAHQTAEMQKGDTFVAAIKQVGRAPIQRSPEEQARLEELMNSLSGLRVEQIDATHLSGPNTLEPPIAIPVVDEVTQELKSVWRPAETDDEIGRMGAYRIQRVLGAGGMGAVFLAVDSQLHRKVALKMMRPRAAAAPGAADRFLREARAAAALRHDHILTIYQVGEEAGVPYLAMEYLEGESLEDRLKRESPLPIADALRIGREIAEGLTAAHAKGLIHRDIKPANVWLEQNANSTHPRVKLLDFGLARSTEDDLQLTSTGMVIGTPSYMSPEQASGEDLDGRADLFSLGVILYRMTTGQLPFPGKKPIEVLKSLATLNPTAPHTLCDVVPPELSNLVMKLLAKDRDERPVTASEVAKTLSEMAGRGPAIPTQPASSMSELPAPHENPIGVRRRNLNGWLIAAAGCAAFALLSVIVITLKDENGNVTEITVNAPKGTKVVDVKQSVDEKLARTNKPEIPQAAQSPSNPAPVTVNQSVISQRKVSVPLSETCLVTNPAPLPGVESWSIETLQPRGWTDDPVFDPTGRWMAILNFEGVVRILDAQSGRVARMLVGHEGQVASAAWSLDGKWIVTSGRDQTIKLWEFDSGKLIQTYPQSGTAYSMAFSDDGKWLAGCISGTKPTICIWEAVTGKFVRSLDVATDSSRHRLAWLPGKSTLSTVNLQTGGLEFVEASLDAVIRSEKLQSASQTWAELFEAKWSHDRSRIAGVLSGNRIAIWDALG